MRLRHVLFLLAACGLAAALAGCAGGSPDDSGTQAQAPMAGTSSFHPVAGNFKPDDTRLSSCKGSFPCFEQAFGNLVYRAGPKEGFVVLERMRRTTHGVESDCHRIVHAMGSAALARYDGDVARTFGEGDSTCNSGYYHGILERSFAGAKSELELQTRANEVCRSRRIQLSQWLNFSCLHGLGHGLMIQTGYALPTSLGICKGLDRDWNREVCAGGVFMENFFSTYGVQSRYLKDSDPIYPCDAKLISDDFRIACYLIVTSRVLDQNGYDWKRTAELCSRADQPYRDICFESYGRDASGKSEHHVPRIAEICRIAGVDQEACFFGAARELNSNDANPTRAGALCRLAPRPDRPRCFYGIGTIVGQMQSESTAEQRAVCSAAAGPYTEDCLAGVRDELRNH